MDEEDETQEVVGGVHGRREGRGFAAALHATQEVFELELHDGKIVPPLGTLTVRLHGSLEVFDCLREVVVLHFNSPDIYLGVGVERGDLIRNSNLSNNSIMHWKTFRTDQR